MFWLHALLGSALGLGEHRGAPGSVTAPLLGNAPQGAQLGPTLLPPKHRALISTLWHIQALPPTQLMLLLDLLGGVEKPLAAHSSITSGKGEQVVITEPIWLQDRPHLSRCKTYSSESERSPRCSVSYTDRLWGERCWLLLAPHVGSAA